MYADVVSDANTLSLTAGWGPLAMNSTDWSNAPGTDANAGVALAGLTAGTYVEIPLTDAAGFPEIDKSGNTDIRLDISQRAADAAPTGTNRFQTRSVDDTAFLPPMLIVQVSGLAMRNQLSSVKHAIGAGLPSSEGGEGYDSTRKMMWFHDGVRGRATSVVGFMPYAYPIGISTRELTNTTISLPLSGGSMATAVVLEGHMLLESITFRENSSAQARGPVSFYIYEERLGNRRVLDLVAGATGILAAFTPSAGSNRIIAVTTPPVYLAPGTYWVVLRNENTARVLQAGGTTAGTMGQNVLLTQTLASAPGSALDFITGWTKVATPWTGLRLNGRVFGQAAAF